MKDYSYITVTEAVYQQMMRAFVKSIIELDEEVAVRRLAAVINANGSTVPFLSLAGQFISLVGTKTSVDNE